MCNEDRENGSLCHSASIKIFLTFICTDDFINRLLRIVSLWLIRHVLCIVHPMRPSKGPTASASSFLHLDLLSLCTVGQVTVLVRLSCCAVSTECDAVEPIIYDSD